MALICNQHHQRVRVLSLLLQPRHQVRVGPALEAVLAHDVGVRTALHGAAKQASDSLCVAAHLLDPSKCLVSKGIELHYKPPRLARETLGA